MNRLSTDLHGKVVVLASPAYVGDDHARRFLCLGGFGCNDVPWEPMGHGTRINGVFLVDGERASVHGGDVARIDDDQETGVTPELAEERREVLEAEAAWKARRG